MVKDVHRVAKINAMREVKIIEDSKSASLRKDERASGGCFGVSTSSASVAWTSNGRVFQSVRDWRLQFSFILGFVLICISTFIGLDEENRGLSFLVLGLLAFIPGSYATYQLYGAWKGWKGYDYAQIPSYDD
ncbi:unnamed protein product [Peronospora destructor]|uniref:Transmembrane protein 230 n=1 Tax=Peronospora destructor TaxID=86335 RepID=A0AAV0UCI2_9STRA|nr:unnamed protein product [Peronospora destructor]